MFMVIVTGALSARSTSKHQDEMALAVIPIVHNTVSVLHNALRMSGFQIVGIVKMPLIFLFLFFLKAGQHKRMM